VAAHSDLDLTDSTVVVGAGIAGVSCARVLAAVGERVVVLDRGRRAGGRMARWTRDDRAIDVGAAYFTVRDPDFASVADDWARRGLAHPWTDSFAVDDSSGRRAETSGPVRWAAEGAVRSLVEDLATGLDLRLEHEVESVGVSSGGTPLVDGRPVQAAVLALPDPQARDLLSDDHADAADLDAEWHPVITVVARFPVRTWRGVDGIFVHDSPLSLLVDDGRRRGDGAPVLVAHCTHDVSRHHLDRPDEVVPVALAEMRRLVPALGEPEWVEAKRWGTAAPRRSRTATYHLDDAGIAICGDGWSQRPRVEAAWISGRDAGTALAARLR
jgi:renalase